MTEVKRPSCSKAVDDKWNVLHVPSVKQHLILKQLRKPAGACLKSGLYVNVCVTIRKNDMHLIKITVIAGGRFHSASFILTIFTPD